MPDHSRAHIRRRHALLALLLPAALSAQAGGVPPRLSDEQFWKLVSDFSEAPGNFRSDNFVSNEVTFQYVIPELLKGRAPAGAYLGVGPDQNFTYIVALRPKISFIVDIRRGAILQHLMYKAIIEMSKDRADYLSMLFARPRPAGVGAESTPEALFQAFFAVPADSGMWSRTLKAIKDRLVKTHGFTLSPDDSAGLDYVYTSFYAAGPDITYNYAGPGNPRGSFGGMRGMPTFATLMVQDDGNGVNRGYLGTEENFRVLREMQVNNLIVPVVGPFQGPKALRAIGGWLREHGTTVSAVYTSNVEQYLFQSPDDWRAYYLNIGTMPIDQNSTFVRAVFNYGGFRPSVGPGPRSVTMLQPIGELLKALADGRINSYADVIFMSR